MLKNKKIKIYLFIIIVTLFFININSQEVNKENHKKIREIINKLLEKKFNKLKSENELLRKEITKLKIEIEKLKKEDNKINERITFINERYSILFSTVDNLIKRLNTLYNKRLNTLYNKYKLFYNYPYSINIKYKKKELVYNELTSVELKLKNIIGLSLFLKDLNYEIKVNPNKNYDIDENIKVDENNNIIHLKAPDYPGNFKLKIILKEYKKEITLNFKVKNLPIDIIVKDIKEKELREKIEIYNEIVEKKDYKKLLLYFQNPINNLVGMEIIDLDKLKVYQIDKNGDKNKDIIKIIGKQLRALLINYYFPKQPGKYTLVFEYNTKFRVIKKVLEVSIPNYLEEKNPFIFIDDRAYEIKEDSYSLPVYKEKGFFYLALKYKEDVEYAREVGIRSIGNIVITNRSNINLVEEIPERKYKKYKFEYKMDPEESFIETINIKIIPYNIEKKITLYFKNIVKSFDIFYKDFKTNIFKRYNGENILLLYVEYPIEIKINKILFKYPIKYEVEYRFDFYKRNDFIKIEKIGEDKYLDNISKMKKNMINKEIKYRIMIDKERVPILLKEKNIELLLREKYSNVKKKIRIKIPPLYFKEYHYFNYYIDKEKNQRLLEKLWELKENGEIEEIKRNKRGYFTCKFTKYSTRSSLDMRFILIPGNDKIKPFFISESEITNYQYSILKGNTPNENNTDANKPKTMISYNEIKELLEDSGFSLPSLGQIKYILKENEEFLKRKNIEDYAWCEENSDGRIHEVKQLEPDKFGIYDLLGNAAEFLKYETYIGESYKSSKEDLKEYYLNNIEKLRGEPINVDIKSHELGFRIVYNLED